MTGWKSRAYRNLSFFGLWVVVIFFGSFSSKSKLPNRPLAALLPCFAIFTPMRASRNAEIVEVLMRGSPEPPVPQMSMAPGKSTLRVICFCKNLTASASS